MPSTDRRASLTLAYAAWVAICLIWGTTYLAIRICLETLPPGLMAGLRWLAAGLLLAAIEVARGHRLPPRTSWPWLALLGLLFIVGSNGLVVWAEQWVPSGLTAVLLATQPFWSVGVEMVTPRGQRADGRTWLGLVIGFTGIALLVWPDLMAGGTTGTRFLGGVLALQGACLAWAVGSTWSLRVDGGQHTLGAVALEMVFAGLMLTACGSAAGEWSRVAFSIRSGLAFAYLVTVGSIVGYTAYLYALPRLPISTISLYAYINPIVAVVLGTLVAGEPFGIRTAIASAIVLAGVAAVPIAAQGGPVPAAVPAADTLADSVSAP